MNMDKCQPDQNTVAANCYAIRFILIGKDLGHRVHLNASICQNRTEVFIVQLKGASFKKQVQVVRSKLTSASEMGTLNLFGKFNSSTLLRRLKSGNI